MASTDTPGRAQAVARACRPWHRPVALAGLVVGLGGCVLALRWEPQAAAAGGWQALAHYGIRVGTVALALVAWFLTQAMIGSRRGVEGTIADGLHDLTAPMLRALQARPGVADAVLILSSAGIDLFGVFLIGAAVLGPSMRPFVGLLVLFSLRQVCQAVCALPPPRGMIWRHPGFPSLLVTYAVGNDFFFSGHTAIAVLGALELARLDPWLGLVGAVGAALEAGIVITLRAHYTMDVFAAALAAWGAFQCAGWLCAGR